MPLDGGKKLGLMFAQNYFSFDDSQTLVAGDSENDVQMFRGGHWGVCVRNCQPDFEFWIRKKTTQHRFVSDFQYGFAVLEAIYKMSR